MLSEKKSYELTNIKQTKNNENEVNIVLEQSAEDMFNDV